MDHYHRGTRRFETGNFSGAIKEYTKAIAIYPEFAKAYLGRGLALLVLGRDAEAEQDLNHALQLDASLKNQIEAEAEKIKQKRSKPR